MQLKINLHLTLCAICMFSSVAMYSQKYKPVGLGIIDSVLKYRNTNRVIGYNTLDIRDESILGVKLYMSIASLQKKFGKGTEVKKRIIDDRLDSDNPKILYRRFVKYQSTLFEIDDKNRVFGYTIEDSLFVLEPLGIKVGDRLEILANKLSKSFQEIVVYEDRFDLMIRVIGLNCGDCRGNIGLTINRKTRRLISITQRIEENNF